MSSIDDNVKVELDEIQRELILTNLDEEGKLSCLKAFKVARLIGRNPKDTHAVFGDVWSAKFLFYDYIATFRA